MNSYYRTSRIYRRSLDLIDFVVGAPAKLPHGTAFLGDQLRRSSASVPVNYLEGCGRSGEADRRRFFQIAIGSAEEVAGTFEVMPRFGVLTVEEMGRGQEICDHVIAMLRRYR